MFAKQSSAGRLLAAACACSRGGRSTLLLLAGLLPSRVPPPCRLCVHKWSCCPHDGAGRSVAAAASGPASWLAAWCAGPSALSLRRRQAAAAAGRCPSRVAGCLMRQLCGSLCCAAKSSMQGTIRIEAPPHPTSQTLPAVAYSSRSMSLTTDIVCCVFSTAACRSPRPCWGRTSGSSCAGTRPQTARCASLLACHPHPHAWLPATALVSPSAYACASLC